MSPDTLLKKPSFEVNFKPSQAPQIEPIKYELIAPYRATFLFESFVLLKSHAI